MKITAKGMFKRLGYERERILNERFISYRKPYGNSFCYIQFDLKDKTFYSYTSCGMANQTKSLTANELKAVKQQMNELGWP